MENLIQQVINLDLVEMLDERGYKLTSTDRQLKFGTLQFRKYYKNERKIGYNKNDEVFQGYVIYANGTVRFETSDTYYVFDKKKNQAVLFKGKSLETIDDYIDVLEYVVDLVKGKIDNKRYTKNSRNKLKSKIEESTIMSYTQFVNESTEWDYPNYSGNVINILRQLDKTFIQSYGCEKTGNMTWEKDGHTIQVDELNPYECTFIIDGKIKCENNLSVEIFLDKL